MLLHLVNGPNLNLIGKREPEIYGYQTFADYLDELKKIYSTVTLEYFQSNQEGELIDYLQQIGYDSDGILLNAGGFTHTSVAIADAIAAIETKVLEIHISNPKAREEQRQISLIEKHCHGTISGLGLLSYRLGIDYFKLKKENK